MNQTCSTHLKAEKMNTESLQRRHSSERYKYGWILRLILNIMAWEVEWIDVAQDRDQMALSYEYGNETSRSNGS
jgi:hypothetical protein